MLEIQFFGILSSHSSKPLPPKSKVLGYLSSVQQDLTGEPQENMRKPIITVWTLHSDS